MESLPVSVCIIAGNEAQRIRKVLESVQGWTSEIVILLNQEVNDSTDKVAAEFGAKVFREPWKGFIGQKNSAAEKCSQPWLLNLDADEAVTPELKKEIQSLLASGTPPHTAYEFPRCTFFCGRWIRHGDWYPDRVQRLWRRGTARWAGEEPHARLQIDGTVGRLNADLLHYNADTLDRQIAKISQYSEDFLRDALARNRRVGGLDLVIHPAWRFVRTLIFRLGFLDGWQGWYIAWMTAFYTATRYAKVRAHTAAKSGPP